MRRALLLLATAALLPACASIPKDAGFTDVAAQSASILPVEAAWPGQTISETKANERIGKLLSSPLTEDAAIEVEMLSNRGLRAQLYGMKAARGDYADASSLPNPFLSAVVFDVQGEDVTNLEFGIGYELLELMFLPRKMKASGAEFNAAKSMSSAAYIDLATDVRIAYYEALAAKQTVDLLAQAKKATTASTNAARALRAAGNIPELALNREELLSAEMDLASIGADMAMIGAREHLNGLLGLSGEAAQSWSLKGRLRNPPKIDDADMDMPKALEANLALAAMDARIEAAAERLGITNVTSLIGDLELELARERDDGEWESGVGAGFEVPIFNFGQGKREAAGARLQAMIEQRMADKISMEADARRLAGELKAARQAAVLQRKTILPLAGKVLKGTQLDYNAMQVGVFGLLDAKRDQLAAGQNFVLALRGYWTAKARYDQLMAGGSPSGGMSTMSMVMSSNSSGGGDH